MSSTCKVSFVNNYIIKYTFPFHICTRQIYRLCFKQLFFTFPYIFHSQTKKRTIKKLEKKRTKKINSTCRVGTICHILSSTIRWKSRALRYSSCRQRQTLGSEAGPSNITSQINSQRTNTFWCLDKCSSIRRGRTAIQPVQYIRSFIYPAHLHRRCEMRSNQ